MIDSLRRHLDRAIQSDIRGRLGIEGARFGLITLHRPANVDDEGQLNGILEAMRVIAQELPLFWPVHPRILSRLQNGILHLPESIHVLEPLGYLKLSIELRPDLDRCAHATNGRLRGHRGDSREGKGRRKANTRRRADGARDERNG